MRLHIGGGMELEPTEGWKVFDVQPGPAVDFVGDCADLGRFASDSVDEIYASHVLEHLGYLEELPRTLQEFHRVLRKGGTAKISVPDFEVLARIFLETSDVDERYHILRMIFGGQVDPFDYHYFGLTIDVLCQFLGNAGFTRVEKVEEFGLFKDSSAIRYQGRLISLNVIAFK